MEEIIQAQMKVSLYWGILRFRHLWLQATELKRHIIRVEV